MFRTSNNNFKDESTTTLFDSKELFGLQTVSPHETTALNMSYGKLSGIRIMKYFRTSKCQSLNDFVIF